MKLIITIALAVLSAGVSLATDQEQESGISFEFVQFTVDGDDNLHWSTINEVMGEIFMVEQYVYNRWTTVGTVSGLGQRDTAAYSFRVANLIHSGTNSFRIRKPSQNHLDDFTEVLKVESAEKQVFHFVKRNQILLSKRVYYYIYDENGIQLRHNYGSVIDVTRLKNESFYLCFDNQVVLIKKGFLNF